MMSVCRKIQQSGGGGKKVQRDTKTKIMTKFKILYLGLFCLNHLFLSLRISYVGYMEYIQVLLQSFTCYLHLTSLI